MSSTPWLQAISTTSPAEAIPVFPQPGYDEVTGLGTPVANLLVPALVSTVLYSANMNTNPGWTFDSGSQWAYGTPTGSGGDPSSGYTGSNVVGYNLNGDYPTNMPTTYWATTPAINCSGYTAVSLDFWEWLGVAGSRDTPTRMCRFPTMGRLGRRFFKTAPVRWSTRRGEPALDISAVAANQPTVYIRWGMGPTDSRTTYGGWNIDDVTVAGLSTTSPTVVSLTPNLTTVADANVGTAAFA